MAGKPDSAVALHMEGYNCAQSVLVACGQSRGLAKETSLRVAQAFGGGIGRTGGICGALSGALMAVGLECAAIDPADMATKVKSYELAQAVVKKFAARNKTLMCRELTGCDMTTEAGMKKFLDEGVSRKVCDKAICDAVEIVEEVLAANKK